MKEINKNVLNALADCMLEHIQNNEGEYFELESGEYFMSGTLNIDYEWEDQSFSHEFGIEYCGEWKPSELSSIDIEWFGWINEDGEDFELEFKEEFYNYIINYINLKL